MLFKVLILAAAAVAVSAKIAVQVPQSGRVTFQSPNYPANYPDNSLVTYVITGPVGFGIQFDQITFDLEAGTYDTLRFSEVVNGVSVVIGGAFSGTSGPSKLRSATNSVTAVFKTDSSINKAGFQIAAKVPICALGQNGCRGAETVCVKPSQYCDGVVDCPDASDENCPEGCGNPVYPPSVDRFNQLIQALGSNPKIVGGVEAAEHSWPWQISMTTSSGSHICGGSIINNEWIMTAAHCCMAYSPSPSNYKVRVGAHNIGANEESAKVHSLKRVIVHPSYGSPNNYANDFCLLEVSEPIIMSPEVSPVCLADETDGPAGQSCWVTGWGSTGANRLSFEEFIAMTKAEEAGLLATGSLDRAANLLRQVDVKITTQAACSAAYPNQIAASMICASNNGKDSCQGDSGGPFVCQDDAGAFKLVGVVSWGRGCAQPGYPGVYARTATALDWIATTIYS